MKNYKSEFMSYTHMIYEVQERLKGIAPDKHIEFFKLLIAESYKLGYIACSLDKKDIIDDANHI